MMSRRVLLLVPCALFLLAGCGGDAPDENAARTAADVAPTTDNPSTLTNDIALIPHPEGRFEADWPVGTGRLRTRFVESTSGANEHATVRVDCVRDGDALRGCSITVWFELPGGRVPGPDDVTHRLGAAIREHELEVLRQFPIERDGMEGVTVMCHDAKGGRYAWMEGFLHHGRVLVVSAWDRSDALFSDPEVREFLGSVVFTDF